MATPALAPAAINKTRTNDVQTEPRGYALSLISGLTAAALVVHGFHPFAEDGGLYLAGVKRVLDPTLYSEDAAFVQGHLRFSLFAPAMAWLVQHSGLELETLVLLVYLATIWLTLMAAWMLAGRCFHSLTQRTCAVTLLATWLTLPIAGTSLMLMDPYVTARSLSTPLTILALVGAIDLLRSLREGLGWNLRAMALTLFGLSAAAAMHPLMAGYGATCVLALAATTPTSRAGRAFAAGILTASAIGTATMLYLMAQAESNSYREVAISRYYWFLSQWHWYELLGIAAPLIILGTIAWCRRSDRATARHETASMGVLAGSIAVLVAILFARVGAANHMVARMQPLRVFQLVYIAMIVLLGGELARWLNRNATLWVLTFGTLAVVMIYVERATFPSSDRIEVELAREQPRNNWVQAFEWVRHNTPKSAVFALDADYITRDGEDAHCFRAIAERSALPDYSKDGGEAAITPDLTERWNAGQRAQRRLSEQSDAQRIASLAGTHADWVLLESQARTGFTCVYANSSVKACRLPPTDAMNAHSTASNPLQ